MPDDVHRSAHIGVFDSGIGGLSVLRALLASGTRARWHYTADSAHAPYGERTREEILARSMCIASRLIDDGARMVVVACNTATAQAIDQLRARWPAVVFVGIEPAIKPAVAITRNGRVGVMATPATLSSERFRRLVERHAEGVHIVPQPCPGLAAAIERCSPEDAGLRALVAQYASALAVAAVDTVVLGCTHYPLVRDLLQAELGADVTLVDPADAVASRVRSLWSCETDLEGLRLSATGDAQALASAASRWLGVH